MLIAPLSVRVGGYVQYRDRHTYLVDIYYFIYYNIVMNIMIDIETLSVSPDATILTIAAQCFDPFSRGYLGQHQYYARITLESQADRAIDDGTLDWWATQPAAAAEAFAEDNRVPLPDALDELCKLCWKSNLIWMNGPTFDATILEHAFKSRGKHIPWQYYKIRDARTIYSLWPDCPKPPAEHHALKDCQRQIDMLQETFRQIGIKKIR
jgi:hypothetical protein